MRIIKIGKPTHLAANNKGWSKCGINNCLISNNIKEVNCLRCLKSYEKCNRMGRISQN